MLVLLSCLTFGTNAQNVQTVPFDSTKTDSLPQKTALINTGYGHQPVTSLTGAFSSADSATFNAGHIYHPAQLVRGRLNGLSVFRPGSNPNEDFTLRVRSLSTIIGNPAPLIVVDGLPQRSLDGVDPFDIERIELLKDGSAAAIYGIRGGGGVLQVTTKNSSTGPPRVKYHGYVTMEQVAKKVPVLSSGEYRRVEGSEDFGNNTDWQDAITRRTAFSHAHQLALSGGTLTTRYRASLTYRDVEGIQKNTGFRRYGGRLNLRQQALKDRLTLTLNLSGSSRPFQPGFDDAFRYAVAYNPTAPVRLSPDGPLPPFFPPEEVNRFGGYWQQFLFNYYNPVALIEQNRAEGNINTWSGQLRGNLELIKGLRIGAFYARRQTDLSFGRYFSKFSFWKGADRNGLAEQRHDEKSNQLFESTLSFKRRFGPVGLDLLGGYAYQYYLEQGSGAEGGNFLTDAFSFHNLSAAQDFTDGLGSVFSYKQSHKLAAFFGRARLDWDDTYFLTLSMRREGSSRLGANNKWGAFPAVQAGVQISSAEAKPDYRLFFRAGYGLTGNIPRENFLSLQRYRPQLRYLYNGEWIPVYTIAGNPNPDLKWETNRSLNFGLDAAFFGERLRATFDYYHHRTENLLLEYAVTVPPNVFDRTYANAGKMETRGFELWVQYRSRPSREWSWQGSLNLSAYRTKLLDLTNENYDFGDSRFVSSVARSFPAVRIKEREEVGQLFGLTYLGVSPEGNWIFQDRNRDGVITPYEDASVIGNGMPNLELGFNQTFRYGRFDLSLFFRGVFGHDLAYEYGTRYETPIVAQSYNLLNSYRELEDLKEYSRFSSRYVENASFLTLDNLTLGYSLPAGQKSVFSQLRFYLNSQNLFTLTSYPGPDPEPRLTDEQAGLLANLAPGIDRPGLWLPARGWTVGVLAGF